ncbi:sugar phosphate nucleotidyltransferase [Hazenella coriacea]|uniref:Mannose-1-phosphate guanylyltransferase n=1 Tax=Hazenella coriacea TaxID=1179467 RepID=A0A4R3L804_9BACL|nr:sugar phosphate nucleotidyltransferase [Hazenella coriacea]TCS93636.1 mannose-1-phosphate guanylyltransferase [Hazenella coriacea]
MKLILLSGGSGTRLWPLSDECMSKQFLKLLKNDAGQSESMIQRIIRQIKVADWIPDTYIATNQAHVPYIHEQLGDQLPLIVEPERRDTFPAIALASLYLYEQGVSLDEVIGVCPVDLYIEDSFFSMMKQAEQTLKQTDCDLVMIGIRPTEPSEKYGYIVPENSTTSPAMKVKHFIEKPTQDYAEQLIQQHACWNSGVFCFQLRFLIDLLKKRHLPLSYTGLYHQYQQLPQISFDYEVVEKMNSAVVLSYEGTWNDMGTWDTLTTQISDLVVGKGILSEDCKNTNIINKLDLPVLAVGLSNTVIVINENGILIAEKGSSTRLKDYLHEVRNVD